MTKDSSGTPLVDGDSATTIRNVRVPGTSVVLRRGTLVRDIRLTRTECEVECSSDRVRGLVLRTEFLRKA